MGWDDLLAADIVGFLIRDLPGCGAAPWPNRVPKARQPKDNQCNQRISRSRVRPPLHKLERPVTHKPLVHKIPQAQKENYRAESPGSPEPESRIRPKHDEKQDAARLHGKEQQRPEWRPLVGDDRQKAQKKQDKWRKKPSPPSYPPSAFGARWHMRVVAANDPI